MTLAWKLTVVPEDPNELREKIVEFLVQHQFDVFISEEISEGMPAILASKEACRMLILKSSPNGWRRHIISELTAATDQVFIVFRGVVYAEQPVLLTLGTHLESRILQKFGLWTHTTPVIAVVAPAVCDVKGLPWYELRERDVL
jgi:hypothetical protein